MVYDGQFGVCVETKRVRVADCTLDGIPGADRPLINLITNADEDTCSEYVIVSGCTFENAKRGIHMFGARRCLVTGNIFVNGQDIYARAITLATYHSVGGYYPCLDNQITNNQIVEYRSGVCLISNAHERVHNNVVSGNAYEWTGSPTNAYGVWEVGPKSDHQVIQGNTITGALYPIATVGAQTVVQGNVTRGQ